jgi:signal transduction histidine kinase
VSLDYRAYPVLCVDDEASNLVTIRYALEDNFTLLTATSGEEALRYLAERDIAVLLADQRMPGMTGSDLCARARELRPDTVRMIVTAYADLHTAVDAINRGQVSRYLTKPWRADELVEVLRTAIEIVHIQRTVREMEIRLLGTQRAVTAYTLQAELVHELGNPLIALEMNLHAATDLTAAVLSGMPEQTRARALLDKIQEAHHDALAAASNLREILDRVRHTGQAVVPRQSRCDAVRVVDSTVRIVRPELERVARLKVVLEGSPVVPMESAALGQMVLNLLLNAAQAIPAGSPESHSIQVEVGSSETSAMVRVSDTGSGIAPDLQARIFDAKFTTKQGNSGLGLAIVRNLVRGAGGDVTVKSTLGQGSTFTLTLPLVES